MSMQAITLDDEYYFDPDDLKMPESPQHRRVTNLIAATAQRLLPELAVYSDMNWYPLDGGNAVAPDVMTLRKATLTDDDKSYRQTADGPLPGVAVEVASGSDMFTEFYAKTSRYRRLGLTVYVVLVQPDKRDVLRCDETGDYRRWAGVPIPELGGLSIDVQNNTVVVVMPSGDVLWSVDEFLDLESQRAEAANDRANLSDQRADAAERRAASLEAKLQALGVDTTLG